MTTQPDRIDALNQRLRQKPPLSSIRRRLDKGDLLAAGQLWSPAAAAYHVESTDPICTWLLLLVEPVGDDLFNAVPVFRWTELAGPDDLILSQALAGTRMAAALGLEATVNRAMLSVCQGRFQSDMVDFLLSARAAASDPINRNAYCWGAPYVGPHDHRIEYATAISNHLESLQAAIRDVAFAEPADQTDVAGSTANVAKTRLRWLLAAGKQRETVALAAKSGAVAADLGESFVILETRLTLRTVLETDGCHCDFEICDRTGTLSSALDGTVVVTDQGESPGFIGGQTRVALDDLENGFLIRKSDGQHLPLRRIPRQNQDDNP